MVLTISIVVPLFQVFSFSFFRPMFQYFIVTSLPIKSSQLLYRVGLQSSNYYYYLLNIYYFLLNIHPGNTSFISFITLKSSSTGIIKSSLGWSYLKYHIRILIIIWCICHFLPKLFICCPTYIFHNELSYDKRMMSFCFVIIIY